MSKIALTPNATGTGVFTISSPATNTDRTLTLPDEAGTVLTSASSITQNAGPAFSAYQSSAQTLSSYVHTKILFQAEEWDTNSNFANSTFTPSVAGYYLLTSSTTIAGSVTGNLIINIYKNGSPYKQGVQVLAEAGAVTVSAQVASNGTTDYFDVYLYQGSGVSKTIIAQSIYAYFQGIMVRAA